MTISKEPNCQFFIHESKDDKLFKFIPYGLDNELAEEVKQEMILKKYKCIDNKKNRKSTMSTFYIV